MSAISSSNSPTSAMSSPSSDTHTERLLSCEVAVAAEGPPPLLPLLLLLLLLSDSAGTKKWAVIMMRMKVIVL